MWIHLVAALGWLALGFRLGMVHRQPLKRYVVLGLLAAAIVLQAVGTLHSFPYYLSYYNPLVGGSGTAQKMLIIGWGEGLDEAARYLNQKPDSTQLQVASWYCPSFAYFFSGTTYHIPTERTLSKRELQRVMNSDYAVIYIHQWQRDIPEELLEYLAQQTPEHVIWIDGLEYVGVYKLTEDIGAP